MGSGLLVEVSKDSNNLRAVYSKFVQSFSLLKDEPDAVMVAERSEWIRVGGEKFYLQESGGSEVKAHVSAKLCQTCKDSSKSGFLALLKKHPKYPENRILFAFQCDTCKLIYVMNIPKGK